MSKWWSVSWKRVGVALLLVFGSLWLITGVAVLAFYQLRPWLTAREIARSYPWLNTVPTAPKDESLTPLAGVPVEFYGLSFQTPWREIANTRSFRGISFVNFKDGASMIVFDPAQDMESALFSQLRANHLLDDQMLRSNYALKAAEMAATSEQIKWWRTPNQNVKHLLPFTLKLIAFHDASALYSLGFGKFRGFQVGNPSVAPYKVVLDLFDGADRHYQLVISRAGDQGPILTQGQINAIVASMRQVTDK